MVEAMIQIIITLVMISTTCAVKAQEVPLNTYEMPNRNDNGIADLIPQDYSTTNHQPADAFSAELSQISPLTICVSHQTQTAASLLIRLQRSAIAALAAMHESSTTKVQKGMKRSTVTRKNLNTFEYICEHCQFGTNLPSHLTQHNNSKKHRAAIDKHKLERLGYKYTCEACQFGTNLSGNLTQHNNSKSHRAAIGEHKLEWHEYRYTCKSCQYGTNLPGNLTKHTTSNKHKKRIAQLANNTTTQTFPITSEL